MSAPNHSYLLGFVEEGVRSTLTRLEIIARSPLTDATTRTRLEEVIADLRSTLARVEAADARG